MREQDIEPIGLGIMIGNRRSVPDQTGTPERGDQERGVHPLVFLRSFGADVRLASRSSSRVRGPDAHGPIFEPMQIRISTIWGRLAEGLMLAYLLTLAAGPALPAWVRLPLLYGVVFAGVMDSIAGPVRLRVRGLIPVGFFLLVHVVTIFTSGHRDLSMGLSVFMPVVAMVFIVLQRTLITRGAIDRLFGCLGLVAVLIAVDGAMQVVFNWSPLTMRPSAPLDRISASLPHPNDLVVVPILLPFAFEWLRARGWRWLVGGVVLIGPAVVVALLASKSRNAWLTMAGVLFVWTLLVLGWRWALGAMLGLGAIALGMYAMDIRGVRARAGDFLRLGSDGRVGLWLVALAMFRESPWLGKGVFTFGEYYKPSWYSMRVRFPAGYTPEAVIIPWAHNLVLELLSERGVIGLASFVWMVGASVAAVWRKLKDPRVAAALTSLAGFLGASMLDLTLMKDWVALMLFLLLALLWRLGDSDGDGGAQKKAPAGAGAAGGN